MSAKLKDFRNWYESHERHVSTVSLIGGFLFDSFALHRIDSLEVNVWLLFNLASVAVCITLINKEENLSNNRDSWKYFWLFNIMQFGFGAVLGGSFRFYLRSGSLSVSWPFLLIVFSSMLSNEFLRKHYSRLVFQLAFFYLSVFILSIFMLPLLVHQIGVLVFLASGILSLFILWLFMKLLKRLAHERFKESWQSVWLTAGIIFVSMNVFYFTNLIPPIPLSLKDAGIYHYISRDALGSYTVAGERMGFLDHFRLHENVHLASGDSLYAYSAIFSPTDLNTGIVHEWQYLDNATGKWISASRIPLFLSGGRANGFRTYSVKSNLSPGDWRVNVETPRGQLIGRISFRVITTSVRPTLVSEVKN